MTNVLLAFLLSMMISETCKAQKLSTPQWDNDYVYFKAAKIKVIDEKKKVLFDGYKESLIEIKSIAGAVYQITIDIPDRFYLKEGTVDSWKYDSNEDSRKISYTVLDGNKMAVVLLSYSLLTIDKSPDNIVVVFTDNFTAKPIKKLSVFFSDFKD